MRSCLLIGLLACSVSNAEPTGVPPEFLTCSHIQKNGERLACYDRAVAYFQGNGEKLGAPSAESSFGMQTGVMASRVEQAKPEQSEEPLSSVTARISDVSVMRDGLKMFVLDNGQTWRQIAASTTLAPRAGDQISVRRGALGSFLMDVPNGPALRVRRVK